MGGRGGGLPLHLDGADHTLIAPPLLSAPCYTPVFSFYSETLDPTGDVQPTLAETLDPTGDVQPTQAETLDPTGEVQPTQAETLDPTGEVQPTLAHLPPFPPPLQASQMATLWPSPPTCLRRACPPSLPT